MIGWLLGNLWPYVAAGAVALLGVLGSYMAGKRHARQKAKIEGLEADTKALTDRERIEDDVSTDPDLAGRAKRAGVLRKPGK